MESLSLIQLCLVGLVFVWSSFVRSAFSFGGALLSLPLLLAIHNDPIVFVPIIATHLLLFSLWILLFETSISQFRSSIDWVMLRSALKWMILPKLIGITGLVLLPAHWMGGIVLFLCLGFACRYIWQMKITIQHPWWDRCLLMLAGYTGGAALLGSPLIVGVFLRKVPRALLRNTLFALWLSLVVIKFIALLVAQVDMQWAAQMWLIPLAVLGHYAGTLVHYELANMSDRTLQKTVGFLLLGIVLLYGFRLAQESLAGA
jgi:hypothetical protein